MDISRRKLLGWTAMAPLAAAAEAVVGITGKAAGMGGPATASDLARQRIQRMHFPNVPLYTHEGKRVMFYDDLVKGRIVTMNFFFAKCDEICPMVMANLARVQTRLAADLNKRLFMYSLTLKPEEDTVDAIREFREMHHARPGWTFLTGKPQDLERVRKGIGFSYPNPVVDKDKTQHIGNVRYGNEPLMLWAACPGMAHADFIAESVSWMIHPEQSHIQPS
ncbi:MAG TPA: SCO family protein [Thermoanaerobaculia bacterium]|jgi:protein SCO1/2|nr:SCO family protein [Thermoanaerobaculia bacterium]